MCMFVGKQLFLRTREPCHTTQRLGIFGERAGLFGVCFGLVRLRVRVALAFAVIAITLLPRMQRFILCRSFVAGVSAMSGVWSRGSEVESGRRPRPLSGLSSGVDGALPLSFDLPRSSAGRSMGLRLRRLRRSSQFFPRSSSRSFTQRSLLRLRLRCLTRPNASGFARRSIPLADSSPGLKGALFLALPTGGVMVSESSLSVLAPGCDGVRNHQLEDRNVEAGAKAVGIVEGTPSSPQL